VTVSATFRTARHASQNEAEVVILTARRRLRLLGVYGTPPGSHIGLWRTRTDDISGWNLRVGRRYVGPCLTVLAHTRPLRPHEERP
jgi:hypothetical protein